MPPTLIIVSILIGWVGVALEVSLILRAVQSGAWSAAPGLAAVAGLVAAQTVASIGLWRLSLSGLVLQTATLLALPVLFRTASFAIAPFGTAGFQSHLMLLDWVGAPWLPLGLSFACTIPVWPRMAWRLP